MQPRIVGQISWHPRLKPNSSTKWTTSTQMHNTVTSGATTPRGMSCWVAVKVAKVKSKLSSLPTLQLIPWPSRPILPEFFVGSSSLCGFSCTSAPLSEWWKWVQVLGSWRMTRSSVSGPMPWALRQLCGGDGLRHSSTPSWRGLQPCESGSSPEGCDQWREMRNRRAAASQCLLLWRHLLHAQAERVLMLLTLQNAEPMKEALQKLEHPWFCPTSCWMPSLQ